MEELYKNIKERRLELGMSQEELAKKVGYTSRSTIARIEHGEINLPQSKVVDIAKALNISASELMGWESNTTAASVQEYFVEHYLEMLPKQQELFERLAYYSERLDVTKLGVLIKVAEGLVEEDNKEE